MSLFGLLVKLFFDNTFSVKRDMKFDWKIVVRTIAELYITYPKNISDGEIRYLNISDGEIRYLKNLCWLFNFWYVFFFVICLLWEIVGLGITTNKTKK